CTTWTPTATAWSSPAPVAGPAPPTPTCPGTQALLHRRRRLLRDPQLDSGPSGACSHGMTPQDGAPRAAFAGPEGRLPGGTMNIGLGLPISDPTALLDWARRADAGPFTTLGLLDCLAYDNPEPLVTLSAVAAVTASASATPDAATTSRPPTPTPAPVAVGSTSTWTSCAASGPERRTPPTPVPSAARPPTPAAPRSCSMASAPPRSTA